MPRVKRANPSVAVQGELFTQQSIRGMNRIIPNPQLILRLKKQVAKVRSKSVVTINKLEELKVQLNALKRNIASASTEQERINLTQEANQIEKTLAKSKELFGFPRNRQVLINRLRPSVKEALLSQGTLSEQQKQYLQWYLAASKKGKAWDYYLRTREIVNIFREKTGKALIE